MATWYLRERLHGGASCSEQLAEARWVYRVDALLTPVGLAFAIAAVEFGWAVLLVLPLFVLLLIFAREREERIDSLLELSDAYRGTAKVLGRMVEHDDAYTGFHTRGVFELSIDVAAELGLDPTQRRNVEFGALLHDIGKITIPNEIINKPGPLTDDEWTIIKTHTIEGQRILEEIGGLMSEIGGIIRSAHERFDGTGYPDGLAGEEIPAESRVVFACDAYNAMTTDRPYREARTPHEALAELRENAGTQFDPTVVEALARVIERELAGTPAPYAVPGEAQASPEAAPRRPSPALSRAPILGRQESYSVGRALGRCFLRLWQAWMPRNPERNQRERHVQEASYCVRSPGGACVPFGCRRLRQQQGPGSVYGPGLRAGLPAVRGQAPLHARAERQLRGWAQRLGCLRRRRAHILRQPLPARPGHDRASDEARQLGHLGADLRLEAAIPSLGPSSSESLPARAGTRSRSRCSGRRVSVAGSAAPSRPVASRARRSSRRAASSRSARAAPAAARHRSASASPSSVTPRISSTT